MRSRWLAGACAVVMAFLWLAATPGPAYGCSCADLALADYADEIERAFVGRLASRTEHSYTEDHGVALVFDVERVYKGPVDSRIEVFTHAQESACGVDVSGRVGIVATRWRGKLNVTSCSSPVAPATLQAVFGAGAVPPEPAGGGGSPAVAFAVGAAGVAAAALAVVAARRRSARRATGPGPAP